MTYALADAKIYTGYQILENHALVIENGRIQDICLQSALPVNMTQVSLQRDNLCAGMIDLQVNGCGGVQYNEKKENLNSQTLLRMQQSNMQHGCSSFLPTLITSSDDFIYAAIKGVQEFKRQFSYQALGLHLEGPYISQRKKGIHDARLIRRPSQKMWDFLCQNAQDIKIITLAPEEVDDKWIRQLVDAGITVSMGHTNATYEEANQGFASGISMATHLFNAMSPLESRAPNAVGAVFDRPDIYAGIIADGMHVDWANVRLSHHIKGNHLLLVTDASLPAGTNITTCEFAGTQIFHKEGKCMDINGTLAGSALTMIDALKNVVHQAGIALDEAIRMATLYPAKAIGIDKDLGGIAINKVANLMVFDSQFAVKKMIINGDLTLNHEGMQK